MKTVIKIPLYVEVETEDGVDRKLISSSVRDYLIPAFFDSIKISDPSRYFSSAGVRKIHNSLGVKFRYRFLSDSDLFVGKGPKSLDHGFELDV